MLSRLERGVQAASRHLRTHVSFCDIPIVDVGPLVQAGSSLEDRHAVGKLLHQACQSVGFFYVKNHCAHLAAT